MTLDTLLERMEEQYKSYQMTLREEIDQIEKSFIEERSELIDSNLKEIESLFSARRENERFLQIYVHAFDMVLLMFCCSKYMEERADRIEEHIKQLESLRVRDAEEYNLVKIKLETDVQVLEQQLQQVLSIYIYYNLNLIMKTFQMRATYQLNTEKLEYNFQVLKKREEENATILGNQKRKITRLTVRIIHMTF
jgi:dynein regulatry complex protein 1